ncbi:unnamed protein product, partial [Choristocarpus tenellus]
QTVKELVDNAVDACRNCRTNQGAPTVRVVLRRTNKLHQEKGHLNTTGLIDEGSLELQVVDNGVGLTDIKGSLALFSSTKSGHRLSKNADTVQAGKYGLGLTLSLLYSQVHFGGVIKVTSAAEHSAHWTLMRCRINTCTGEPTTDYSKTGEKPEGFSSGSDIRILVPGTIDAMAYAKPRLEALFLRMNLTADRPAEVTLICESCLCDMTLSISRGGAHTPPQLLLDNDDLVDAFTFEVSTLENHALQLVLFSPLYPPGNPHLSIPCKPLSHGSLPLLLQALSFVIHPPQHSFKFTLLHNCDAQGKGDRMRIEVAVALQRIAQTGTTSKCRGFKRDKECFQSDFSEPMLLLAFLNHSPFVCPHTCQVTSCSPIAPDLIRRQTSLVPTTVPLLLHRFVNHVPLLDTQSSTACALCAGVARANWRRLGLSLSPARMREHEGRLRFTVSEAPTSLKACAPWSALEGIKAVHVSVSVTADSVPFASLRKDAISHTEEYTSATTNALQAALLSLLHREVGGFRSAREAALEML